MPMTFTDEKLPNWAKMRDVPVEPLDTLRDRLADATESIDPLEAWEIRTGRPWNEMTGIEAQELVSRHPSMMGNPGVMSRFGK